MRVGITYDLRDEYLKAGYSEEETAEFDRADTIDRIEEALQALGHDTDRVGNARQLIERLGAGARWDLVFNICEGLHGTGREAQVPAILDLFEIPYTFADTNVMCACLDKAITKCVVSAAGVPTPGFARIDNLDQAIALAADLGGGSGAAARANVLGAAVSTLEIPLFAKPVAEGTGKGVTPASRIGSPEELTNVCKRLLAEHRQPVLVEQFLPGREFTVGLLGTGPDARCLGTLEIILLENAEADVYSYVNKERCEELVEYRLARPENDPQVQRAEEIALSAWRALGCRDGGRIDVRCDPQGQPSFIEANPLAGLHPEHSDLPMLATALGVPYVELIRSIVDSAATRCAVRREPRSGTREGRAASGRVA